MVDFNVQSDNVISLQNKLRPLFRSEMDPFTLATGIAGFAGLAGFFSTCLDVIGRVDSYKDFEVESRSIMPSLRLISFCSKDGPTTLVSTKQN
ncbi:hypothetical protein BKA64DRAFT_680071 [Cadophora sp. MPI-SDFR-AT-0126]|nr:hypothetical protein BKA64DRAFT_680071 [Leotiomycetes sp. MPI-SDFR-AT-0126]